MEHSHTLLGAGVQWDYNTLTADGHCRDRPIESRGPGSAYVTMVSACCQPASTLLEVSPDLDGCEGPLLECGGDKDMNRLCQGTSYAEPVLKF